MDCFGIFLCSFCDGSTGNIVVLCFSWQLQAHLLLGGRASCFGQGYAEFSYPNPLYVLAQKVDHNFACSIYISAPDSVQFRIQILLSRKHFYNCVLCPIIICLILLVYTKALKNILESPANHICLVKHKAVHVSTGFPIVLKFVALLIVVKMRSWHKLPHSLRKWLETGLLQRNRHLLFGQFVSQIKVSYWYSGRIAW